MTNLHLGAALLAALTLAPLAQAQQNPPPWWRDSELSISLAWDFDNGPTFLQPTLQSAPAWYNPTNTAFTLPTNVVWIPNLAGHTGVLGLVGTGTPVQASFSLKVDNEYAIDWIKIFWVEFDMFEGPTGEVGAQIEKDLLKYGRAGVKESSEPIGGGWNRVTIEAHLIPQPDDEKILFEVLENALGTVAIDNLFVSSKCVKPGDEKGKALGDIDGTAHPLGVIGTSIPRAVAVTIGPGPAFARTYWVSSVSTTAPAPHQVYRLNQSFSVAGPPTTLPDTLAQASGGAQDLCVETVPTGPSAGQYVYALVDRRPAGDVVLRAIRDDGVREPTRDVQLVGFPSTAPSLQFGLAFNPSGDQGNGTFWVSDPTGFAYEFSRTGPTAGSLLETVTIPTGMVGLGYDDTYGHFLGFSNSPRPTPTFGPSQVNGYEWSGYSGLPTGVEFCGDLRIPNPGGPAGGVASGFDVYRRENGDLRMVAVVQLQSGSVVYEMAGPFRFGWSQMGECGMRGGPAFEGSPTFQVTLAGVPNALIAVLYAGFSNDTYLGLPLPGSLAGIGMDESYLSISLDVTLAAVTPTVPGEFVHTIGLPPAGGLSYVPLFFQWLVLDPTVPGALATSQAGKTIAY
jgi:hypothetical protein